MKKMQSIASSTIVLVGLSVTSFVSPTAAYEIKNFQNLKDLQMSRGSTAQIYLPQNRKKQYSVEVFSAWILKDSYYNEILLPISSFKTTKKQFTVCSIGKPIFIEGVSHNYSRKILKQCQNLTIRIKDSQYTYVGYITPTNRI